MDEFDPYAPPETDVSNAAPKKRSKKKKSRSGAIEEAITRLNEHLADAEAVAHDRKEAGGRLRGATIGFVVFTVLVLVATAIVLSEDKSFVTEAIQIIMGVFAGFIVLITVILVVVDIRFPSRDAAAPPEETLKYFLRGISLGRFGYSWATLCPTAREETVEPPVLGDMPVGEGSFRQRTPKDLRDYTQTFARPGNAQMRTMQIKRAVLLREEDDVAIVEVEAHFTSWPQWAQIVSIVAFVLIRLLGAILYLVLFFALRKTHTAVFQKTLIRGSNGVWYVYSGNFLDRAEKSD
ncbi:MAG TPA: hypothetical protein PK156_01835 [Polyangium sp.]|nr:hypothetical protein [Polyangium sp.]